MTTKGYFKDIVLGFVLIMVSLVCMPLMWNFTKDMPFIFEYLGQSLVTAIIMVLAVSCLFLFGGGTLILRNSFKKYLKLVSSNRRYYYHSYRQDRLISSVTEFRKCIIDKGNVGFSQAREILKSVYAISRNPFLGISQRKLNKCINQLQEICPEILDICIKVKYDGRQDFYDMYSAQYECLVISYLYKGHITEESITIAELLQKES